MIIRFWEELKFNKNKYDLWYEKYIFHILDYSKPLQFVSAWILNENFKALEDNKEAIDEKKMEEKFEHQHFLRLDHLETTDFNIHLCIHCGNTNHHFDKWWEGG